MTESQQIAELSAQLAKVSSNLLEHGRNSAVHMAITFAVVKELGNITPGLAERLQASVVEALAPFDDATRAHAEQFISNLSIAKSGGFKPSIIKGGRDSDHDQ